MLKVSEIGATLGTSDSVEYRADGTAVVVKAHGGAGLYSWRCPRSAVPRAAVRAAAARLPLARAPHRRAQRRPTFYTRPPALYVVRAARYDGSFTADAVPAGGRPLMHLIARALDGLGRCRQTRSERVR